MAGPGGKLDVGALASRPDTQIDIQIRSPEPPSELKARLQREAEESRQAHARDRIITWGVVIGIGSIMALCLWHAASPWSSVDDKKWATAILSSIVSAGVGFLTGQAMKK